MGLRTRVARSWPDHDLRAGRLSQRFQLARHHDALPVASSRACMNRLTWVVVLATIVGVAMTVWVLLSGG
ncbi:MAG: hypothetical protein M3317_10710 [Actinomycetota bacterium]|nr:hypothetical protein [Actinomycetota bacterium]